MSLQLARQSRFVLALSAIAMFSTGAVAAPQFVSAFGNDWAQVNQFTTLSWNAVDSVCHGGPCHGALDGIDVTGWSWASIYQVGDLFQHLTDNGIDPPFPGGISSVRGNPNLVAVSTFFDVLGFIPTSFNADCMLCGPHTLEATTSTPAGGGKYYLAGVYSQQVDALETSGVSLSSWPNGPGPLLFRPITAVPTPSSLALLGFPAFWCGVVARRQRTYAAVTDQSTKCAQSLPGVKSSC